MNYARSFEHSTAYGLLPTHYGQAVEEEASSPDWSWLAPLTAGLTGNLVDPVREANVLRAQLNDAIVRGRPVLEIEKLRGRLEAAERRAAVAMDRETTRRVWNQVGMAAAIAGIALVVVGGVVLTAKVVRR